ncbi:acyltransferase [Klebsiella pneumoniae]|uniref:acyltransferase family protein n=1 Tax=Klebsiella pneumoniae TaxID=573 RepID=UPI000B419327|nr:acyltransferase [Klebsiella pneumoniae]QIA82532.1 acyltransferase [Klebsiella pneumoniae]RNU95416.1 acyltransferase [Klebsiella pneumoniae]HBS7226066.1 acyltransferase [Klebsiella pneumoniae]HBS7380520.1 acyltransferase [Klebsiella pneumoniae]
MTFIIYSLLFFVMVFGNYYVCKRIGVTENPYKYRTMDGLRGICATLVIFHHFFWRGGSSDDFFWSTDYLSANVKAIAMLIGHLPVALFFMISGFLFYFVAASKKPLIPFFKGRLLRIYPPVVFSLLIAMLGLVIVNSDNTVCSLGVFKYIPTPLGFFSGGDVCGFKMGPVNSGILWTLIWEWRLYVFVPILMMLLSYFKSEILVMFGLFSLVFMLWLVGFFDEKSASYLTLFISGFMTAILSKRKISKGHQLILFFSGAFLFAVCLVVIRHVYNPVVAISLTPMFLSIASGFSIFGLLANEKFQLLGVTSFSVYLNHGVFQFISKHYLYDYGMYLWQGASVLLIAVTAPVLYKYVELAFQAKKASSLSIMVKP